MSAEKLVILTADQYGQQLLEAAKMGAQIALSEFTTQGGGSNPVLSVSDAAKFLHIGEGTIRGFVSSGAIPHFKIGRIIKFRRSELIGWEPPVPGHTRIDPAMLLYEKRKARNVKV